MNSRQPENNDVILIIMTIALVVCSVICAPFILLAINVLMIDDITGFGPFFLLLGVIALLILGSVLTATCLLFIRESRKK